AGQSQRVDVEPGGETPVTFTHIFDRGGVHTVAVKIAPDHLPRDNAGYLSVRVRDVVRILVLNGKPDPDARHDSGVFLQTAMKPPAGGPGAEQSALEPVMVSGSSFGAADLHTYDVVTLSNVAALNESD